jgi:hypothetical protein
MTMPTQGNPISPLTFQFLPGAFLGGPPSQGFPESFWGFSLRFTLPSKRNGSFLKENAA